MRRRVLIVGASGQFGQRLARRIAAWPDVELVLAARHAAPIEALASEIGGEIAVLDRNDLSRLKNLEPWAVIDCAGPFQGQSYAAPRAVLESRAHYIDLADDRAFVTGFSRALGPLAEANRLVAVSGASSTPALSDAVLDRLTKGWSRIDRVMAAICPAPRATVGPNVVKAILTWTGQPVQVFTGGQWKTRAGWSGLRRLRIDGVGARWLSLAETPDLDLMVERYRPTQEALLLAGVGNPVAHLGLSALSALVRARLIASLTPLAVPLHRASQVLARSGSTTGAMQVTASGLDAVAQPVTATWTLLAHDNVGPFVPTLPAAAALRGLLDGRIAHGARTAAGLLSLEDILTQSEGLPIIASPIPNERAGPTVERA